MRTALMTCLLATSVAVAISNGAVAQSVCDARCQGNSACWKRCTDALQRRSLKPRYRAPPPSHDANDRSDDWRERAFRIEGGAGGSGGSM
jgi:hypothetical protein